jgi:hypothetical protein
MTAVSPYQLFRPFLWIAAVAFLSGFGGYLALNAPSAPTAQRAQAVSAPGVEPADDRGPLRAV